MEKFTCYRLLPMFFKKVKVPIPSFYFLLFTFLIFSKSFSQGDQYDSTTVPSPWFEGMEGPTSYAPAGWWSDPLSAFPYMSSTVDVLSTPTHEGNYLYSFYVNLYGLFTYGEFSTLNVGPILEGDKLSFKYKHKNDFSIGPGGPGDGTGYSDVYISTNYGATYTHVLNIPNNSSQEWQYVEIDLAGYVDEKVKVKVTHTRNEFEGLPDAALFYYLGYDNFAIGSCLPASSYEQISQEANSVELKFGSNPNDSYEIEYGLPGFVVGNGTLLPPSATNQIAISDLQHSTEYQFYVKKVCGSESSPKLGPYKFFTTCGVYESIYEEFNTFPYCWSRFNNTQTISSSAVILRWQMAETIQVPYLISPQTDQLGNGTKRLRFYARTPLGSPSSTLIVGTMTDPNDISTFTPIPNADISILVSGTFEEYFANLPTGTDNYFAFKLGDDAQNQVVHIDRIYYETIPLCNPVTQGSLIAENITTTQALLSWEVESEIANFDIEYGLQGFTQGTGILVQNVTNDYLLTDLAINTNYSYYVRSHCPGQNYGNFVGPFNFKTQNLVTSPWQETFPETTVPDGWNLAGYNIIGTNSSIGVAQTNYLIGGHYSSNSPYVNTIQTLNVGPILAGDRFSFEYITANTYELGAPELDSGNLSVYISTDFGQTYSLLNTFPNNGVSKWQKLEFSLEDYIGETIRIKIETSTYYGPEYDYFYDLAVDKFYVGQCPLATTPTVKEFSETSVTLHIEGDTSNSFQIEYGLAGFEQGTGILTPVFTGNEYTISNLVHSTAYDYFIKSVCLDSDSSFIGRYQFYTVCGVFDQINESFENVAQGTMFLETIPYCWTFIDTDNSAAGYVTPMTGAGNVFHVYNSTKITGDVILVSPQVDSLASGYKRVRFKLRKSDNFFDTMREYDVVVGTLSNNLDAESFIPVQTIRVPAGWQEFVVYFPQNSAEHFGFKFELYYSSQRIYIDDINYETIPDCVPPFNLSVDRNFQDLTATLKWESPEVITDHNFIVEWGAAAGFTLGTGTQVSLSAHQLQIDNLDEDGIYTFYVKRVCGNESTSFVGPFSFDMNPCIPAFIGDVQLISASVAGFDLPAQTDGVGYQNISDSGINLGVGEPISLEIEYRLETYTEAGYTYVFVDLNRNGVFDPATELFHYEEHSAHPEDPEETHTYTGEFVLSGEFLPGNYDVRLIWTPDEILPLSACSNTWFGMTYDLNIFINFPCDPPSEIILVEKDFTSATLNWENSEPNTPYDIQYGLAGFDFGTGTVIENVYPPYTIENLIPGTEYDFYIKKECNLTGGFYWSEPISVYFLCDTPPPTGEAVQTLYLNEDNLTMLDINGENLKFYTDPSMTNHVPATTMASQTTYYVTQTINCESDGYLAVTIQLLERIGMPSVNTTQSFCDGAMLNQIQVSGIPGAQVNWFNSETSEDVIPSNTQLTTGTYYVSQTDGVTTSFRVPVSVTVNYTPPSLVSQTIQICGTSNFASITTNNQQGATVKWYLSENTTQPINPGILVETGTYYVSQAVGNCESSRVPFYINQQTSVPEPIAVMQVFCGSGLVSDLVAVGEPNATLNWYSSANSITPLSPSTPLVTGTYYVSQTLNACTSTRKAVAVRVVSIAPPIVDPFVICNKGEISDLVIYAESGVTHNWYISPSSPDILPQNTPLVSGTYFVSRIQYGCESLRTPVTITIESIPSQPTGQVYQSFVQGSTVSDLILNQSNVVWYSTYSDAQLGINPLSPNMPLVNGMTYYAVIIGTNGCPSLPLAVTVNIYLSNDKFELDKLKYYPNPVEDILNIEYVDILELVNVYDLQGKLILTKKFDSKNIELNLSSLSIGNYIIQLNANNRTQFIKVIKK